MHRSSKKCSSKINQNTLGGINGTDLRYQVFGRDLKEQYDIKTPQLSYRQTKGSAAVPTKQALNKQLTWRTLKQLSNCAQ